LTGVFTELTAMYRELAKRKLTERMREIDEDPQPVGQTPQAGSRGFAPLPINTRRQPPIKIAFPGCRHTAGAVDRARQISAMGMIPRVAPPIPVPQSAAPAANGNPFGAIPVPPRTQSQVGARSNRGEGMGAPGAFPQSRGGNGAIPFPLGCAPIAVSGAQSPEGVFGSAPATLAPNIGTLAGYDAKDAWFPGFNGALPQKHLDALPTVPTATRRLSRPVAMRRLSLGESEVPSNAEA
jgi:hypothetical protein